MQEQGLPSFSTLSAALAAGLSANLSAPESLRQRAISGGGPGGALRLPARRPVVIVPDLHARPEFVDALCAAWLPQLECDLGRALAEEKATLLFLGDIPHAEGPEAARRWVTASRKLAASGEERAILSPEMDEEMGLSLRALLRVIDLETNFPGSVFCLKGNHDNMTNAADHGDFPFYKYADEGRMGALWLRTRYGHDIAAVLREYELSLPIAAIGDRFCASHAEPAFPITEAMLRDYRQKPDVVRALIWTANGEAEPGAVAESLSALLGSAQAAECALWFAGHRPISGAYAPRAGGRLIQIHNPSRWQLVYLIPGEGIARCIRLTDAGEGTRARPHLEETARLVLDPFAREK